MASPSPAYEAALARARLHFSGASSAASDYLSSSAGVSSNPRPASPPSFHARVSGSAFPRPPNTSSGASYVSGDVPRPDAVESPSRVESLYDAVQGATAASYYAQPPPPVLYSPHADPTSLSAVPQRRTLAAAKTELWHVFTFYSMSDQPKDPSHITRHALNHCARDAKLVPPLLDADIENIFVAEVTRAGKRVPGSDRPREALKQFPVQAAPARHVEPSRQSCDRRQMNFEDFLNVLATISDRVYGHVLDEDDRFMHVVFDHVLAHCKRRAHHDIRGLFLAEPTVAQLYAYFAEPLAKIFGYFASHDERAHARASINSMMQVLTYAAFLDFCKSFGLTEETGLSTMQLCDIYLSSAPGAADDAILQSMSFEGFWEALVRIALAGFSSELNTVPVVDKIKAVMQTIARGIGEKGVKGAWADERSVFAKTDAGGLLQGATDFKKRFYQMWCLDAKRDYAVPPVIVRERGLAQLDRLSESERKRR